MGGSFHKTRSFRRKRGGQSRNWGSPRGKGGGGLIKDKSGEYGVKEQIPEEHESKIRGPATKKREETNNGFRKRKVGYIG